MRFSLNELLARQGIVLLDGSMSTPLEAMGCDLNDPLWTARALAERPELVQKVHLDYFRAGADAGITDSYQATVPGLTARGYSEREAEDLIARSVELLLEARRIWRQEDESDRPTPLCLGSVGPYGAYLADGSEYRGNYGVDDETLRRFHRRRMEILWEAGADLLALETMPSLHEACIAADIAEELGADYYVSFSCRDGSHICEGDRVETCAQVLTENHPHLRMIGVNCTAPQFVESLVSRLHGCCGLPVGAYPNSGETYDPVTKTWHGTHGGLTFGDYAHRWMRAGATVVGGCCRTVDSHIREAARAREVFLKLGR